MFLGKGVLKICSRFTGEHPFRSAISIKLLRHGCSAVNLLHVLRTPVPKNISGRLLLNFTISFRGDRNKYDGDLMFYVNWDFNYKLLKTYSFCEDTEILPLEMNLTK